MEDFAFRRYSPSHGRWISPDPAGISAANLANPQSWNRYAYVLNNPLSNVDPSGLDCVYGPNFDGPFDYETKGGYRVKLNDCNDPNDSGFFFDGTVDPASIEGDGNGNVWASVDGSPRQCSGGCPTDSVTVTATPLANNGSNWAWDFTKSFIGDFKIPSTGPGSCIGVLVGSYAPIANGLKTTQDYGKKYVAPVVASLPGMGASAANALYGTVSYGADRGNALEMSGALSATATFLAAQGQAALNTTWSLLSQAAKNPTSLLITGDFLLAYGVGNEAWAAYHGNCH